MQMKWAHSAARACGCALRAVPGRPPLGMHWNWAGRKVPYGYQLDRESQGLVPQAEESAILCEIFNLYAGQRLGTRGIAAELNRRGIRQRMGKD